MEVLVLLAIGVACGFYDTGKGYKDGVKGWVGKQRGRWADHKQSVRDRRSPNGHVRVRDLPQRAGFGALELLGWVLLTPLRGFRSGWRRRKEAREAWRERHGVGDAEPATEADGPAPPDTATKPAADTQQPTRPDGRPDLRPVPDSPALNPNPNCAWCKTSSLATDEDRARGVCPTCWANRHPRPTPKGPRMSDVNNLEQLKAAQKAVSDAATVNFEDKTADLARAKADLQNAQNLAEQVSATWPNATAAPFKQMVEDAQLAVNAATAALAAAEQRKANVQYAASEVNKQISAEEHARAAGWKGGVTEAAPVLTG